MLDTVDQCSMIYISTSQETCKTTLSVIED